MKDLGKVLFNLQRFQILQTKLNPHTPNLISDHYAYAWYREVYPLLDECSLHEDLEPYFTVTKDEVERVSKYADDESTAGHYYTFYQYEDKFGSRQGPQEGISRSSLIGIFRYMFLKELFDDEFWKKLLENPNYPTEAGNIVSKNLSIYLI